MVIGLVALLVVGPKDLPILMRRVGQMVAKARAMANEFRTSFDEMARQSELDDLRKEVEALRSGQGIYPLGAEADAAFKDINAGLTAPASSLPAPTAEAADPVMTPAADEWPDATPAVESAPIESAKPKRAATRTTAKPKAKAAAAKPKTAKASAATATARPKVTRKKVLDL